MFYEDSGIYRLYVFFFSFLLALNFHVAMVNFDIRAVGIMIEKKLGNYPL